MCDVVLLCQGLTFKCLSVISELHPGKLVHKFLFTYTIFSSKDMKHNSILDFGFEDHLMSNRQKHKT
jgi:hypothetical protein